MPKDQKYQEYITRYASDELERYKELITKNKIDIEECIEQSIRNLENRVAIHIPGWNSEKIKDILIIIGKMVVKQYPEKKEKIIKKIVKKSQVLGYSVNDDIFVTKQDCLER